MHHFPAAQQFVAVAGGQVLQVLAQHFDQSNAPFQGRAVGGVHGRGATGVFVHDFLQAHQSLGRVNEVGVNIVGRGSAPVCLEGFEGSPDGLVKLSNLLIVDGGGVPAVTDKVDRSLGGQPTLGKGAGGELVGGGANAVSGSKQAADGGHLVVAPEVFGRRQVFGAADPRAGLAGMGTHDIGLGQVNLGGSVFRFDVLGGPSKGLGDGHVKKVFPSLFAYLVHLGRVALGQLLHGLIGAHVHRTQAGLNVHEHLVITERSGRGYGPTVGKILVQLIVTGNGVVLAQSIKHAGVEVLEPHAYRTVTVLEAGRHKAVLHLRHFGADGDHQSVGGTGGEHGVPGAANTFVN